MQIGTTFKEMVKGSCNRTWYKSKRKNYNFPRSFA